MRYGLRKQDINKGVRIQNIEYRRKTILRLFWLLTPVFSCFVVLAPDMQVSVKKYFYKDVKDRIKDYV